MHLPQVVIWRNWLLPGSETFVVQQAAALRRWDPLFAGLGSQPSAMAVDPALIVEDDAPRTRLDRALWRRSSWSPRLHALLRRRSVGLLHAHFATDAMAVMRAARIARLPMMFTAHGYDVTERPPGAWDELFAYASRYVAVSDFIAGELVDLGADPAKVRVLPIGIAVRPESPAGQHGGGKVLFVGRLVEKKGCEDLLRAVAEVAPAHPDVSVTIVGDGPLRAGLETLADTLRVRVRFRGHATPDEVWEEMRRATIFCVPSRRAASGDAEGFGMVFLEAAAAGLPVVSCASGGIPEAVVDGQTGLLCAEGDVQGLASAISRLLSDPTAAARLGRAGRERVTTQFDITSRTAALEAVYDEVARRTGRRT